MVRTDLLVVTVVGGDPSDSGMIIGSSGALNKEIVVYQVTDLSQASNECVQANYKFHRVFSYIGHVQPFGMCVTLPSINVP